MSPVHTRIYAHSVLRLFVSGAPYKYSYLPVIRRVPMTDENLCQSVLSSVIHIFCSLCLQESLNDIDCYSAYVSSDF